MDNFVITIARGFGSGGLTIAKMIAERLEIPCYEDEIMLMASEISGISEKEFKKMNQKNRKGSVSRKVRLVRTAFLDNEEEQYKGNLSDEVLFNYQARAIRQLARRESCVIVGYCANYILKDFPNVLAINIQAPYHICTKKIVDRFGLSEMEATALVADTDILRSNYYMYFIGKDWKSYKDYDAILNSHRFGRASCVDHIIGMLKEKLNGCQQTL